MIIVSNRLPVSIVGGGNTHPSLVPSSGGLASAIRELHESSDGPGLSAAPLRFESPYELRQMLFALLRR